MVELWQDREGVRDGGYARVAMLNSNEVLKLTCCEATNQLFTWLLEHQREHPDLALPAVSERYGPVARDADGFEYTGWRIERLFALDDDIGRRNARVHAARLFAATKPAYRHKQARRVSSSEYRGLVSALEDEQTLWTEGSTDNAALALAMALRTTGGLRKTFLLLRDFVTRSGTELDLLTQGNILLNAFGEPCLGDPVCPLTEEPVEPSAPSSESLAVIARLPVKVLGLTVHTAPFSSPELSPAEAEVCVKNLAKLSVDARTCLYGSPQHTAHLGENLQEAPVWQYPGVVQRLQENLYLSTLIS